MKHPVTILFVLLLALLAFFAVFRPGGEDNWMCSDGEWVKHGNPSAPMPEEPCS